MEQNFLEVETCEQANALDMRIWKFITYDSGKYVFAKGYGISMSKMARGIGVQKTYLSQIMRDNDTDDKDALE